MIHKTFENAHFRAKPLSLNSLEFIFLLSQVGFSSVNNDKGRDQQVKWVLAGATEAAKIKIWVKDSFNPGPAGPVSIRIRYACLCGGLRIYPGSPGK